MELNFEAGLLVFLLGLMVGSFVNVLIHRLPRMILGQGEDTHESAQSYDICFPASHCPHCQTPLRAWHNLPLLSYLLLKGRCGFCHHPIGWVYPTVEFATGVLWLVCAWHWGMTLSALCWAWFFTSLLALTVIDWQTTLLPDNLTQPLLWVGLIASANHWVALPLETALWGAVTGYGSLWLVAYVFERVTHRQGMGAGDFKLLGALGAWLGPLALLPLVLLASTTGAVVGIALKLSNQLNPDGYLPFGPFLAVAAGLLALWGPQAVLQLLGL